MARIGFRRRRALEEPEIIVIPMIDVMMFLLFFFMVASLAMAVQSGLPVNLPKASNTQKHPTQNITVTLTASGEIFLNTSKTSLDQISAKLKAIGASPESLIIINADRSVSYGLVIGAISEAGKAGMTRFTFATEE